SKHGPPPLLLPCRPLPHGPSRPPPVLGAVALVAEPRQVGVALVPEPLVGPVVQLQSPPGGTGSAMVFVPREVCLPLGDPAGAGIELPERAEAEAAEAPLQVLVFPGRQEGPHGKQHTMKSPLAPRLRAPTWPALALLRSGQS